jgi:hypothetical protein
MESKKQKRAAKIHLSGETRMSNLSKLESGRANARGQVLGANETAEVNARKCRTCPWRDDFGILREMGEDCQGMMAILKVKVVTEMTQLCHSPALRGRVENRACRGARDYQLEFFHRQGWLEAPTDEAWAAEWQKVQHAESQR